jgi:lipoate-protein ligase A
LGHRYVFIFHGFNLDKNEVTRNMLTEIITAEQEKQLKNLLLGGWGKGFPDRKEKRATIDRIYQATYNQIVDPILRDLQDVLDIEKYEGELAEKEEDTKEICHSLLFNRFVSSDVKNVIACFLKVLHHYTIWNSTPLIDQMRTSQRANLMSGIRRMDKELRSKWETLSRDKKLGLEVAKEYNSLLEHWFRRDDEGESDEKSLWNSIHSPHTPPASPQTDEENASHNNKSK